MAKYLDDKGLKTFTTKMKDYAEGKVNAVDKKVTSHIGNTSNPHGVTKEHVGLGNVTNDKQIPLSQKGATNGVATLGADGKLTSTQIPTTKTINGQSIFGSGNITVSTSLYEIVDALPTKNIDISKIYLVPATTTADKNNKTEYIYIGDPSKAYDATKWEKLGEEQKNATIETPGGSIVVDTAFDTSSSNPIANKTVALRLNTIEDTLNGKVAQEEYNTNKADVNSKLKALEDNTITVDTELKDSVHPVQNKAVNSAVQELNRNLNAKADDADLTTAKGRIETLESNSISKDDITLIPVTDGNGIASIVKENKKLVITQGKFVTSLVGYATTAAMNTALAKKAEKEHIHSQYALTSAIPTKVSDLTNDSGFLTTHQSLDGYVNEVQPDGTQSGNGIANITKEGKILKVTKSTFLTEHQSLADYATKTWVGEQGFAKGTIPTKTSELKNDSGYLVDTVKKAHFNELYMEESPESNGIADIWIDNTNKKELCVRKAKFVKPENLETAINSYASNKGYLTENNLNEKLKETVTIKLVSDKSASDTNLNGATVTVKSGDTTVSTQTWQGTPIEVKVPCDKDVTIEVSTVKMYMKPKALTYVPSPLYNREVTLTYKALETGVFIIDTNDNLINKDSWSPTMQQTTVGVALITEKVAIVISTGLTTDLCWSKTNQLVGGVTTTTDSATAVQDFKGKANTEAIVKALGQNAPAAYYCSNYTFKNGKKGYLMATGESQEIFVNMRKISELLDYINTNTTNLNNGFEIWTSTQKNESMAWCHDGMSRKTLSKTVDNNYVVPIYSLYD